MPKYCLFAAMLSVCLFSCFAGEEKAPFEKLLKIMQQPKYAHAQWGIYAKEAETGKILFDLNSNQLFLPGSVSKLFSVAALLHAYGDQYRFTTPVYMLGTLQNGILKGGLILVGQGDLTMGGRDNSEGGLAFEKMDHIYANEIPGASLTEEDPLKGLQALANQIWEKGVRQIEGHIALDDRLFEKTEKRGMILTPIMLNENLIDLVINPTTPGNPAALTWRPKVAGFTVSNKVKTVSIGQPAQIQVSSDDEGRHISVVGTISVDQKEILRVFSIKDPKFFARAAFIQALENQGISFHESDKISLDLPSQASYRSMTPIAKWTSPPLSEYAKLILKVSHNLGADLIPLLLAAQKQEKTFDKGMALLGQFIEQRASISRGNFVFADAAGGDSNRLTPQATVALLEYIRKLPSNQFQNFYKALPILGVDGSLADVAKATEAAGHVYAKTGTGVSFNLATGDFFLTTQCLAGYIMGKNHRIIEFMIVVNNAQMPKIEDIFPIFEDEGQMAAMIFDLPSSK